MSTHVSRLFYFLNPHLNVYKYTKNPCIYSEMYGRNGVDFIAVSDEKKLSGLCALMLDPDVVVHLLIVAIKAHTIHKCQILARAPKTSRFHIWAISFLIGV